MKSMKKLLFVVLLIVAAGLSCGRDSSANTTDSAAHTCACAKLPSPSAPNFTNRFNQFVMQLCYQKQNWQHDANRRTSEGLHAPFVKLWYSPLMFKWLTVLKSQGPVPDGAIVIKEEYLDTDPTSPILFWSGMIRDSSLWWDGWYWAVVGTESSEPPVRAVPATTGCAEAVFSTNGPTSINCIGCHGSAISTAPGAGTFSTSQFIGSTSRSFRPSRRIR